MVVRKGGPRARTRRLFRKHPRQKGKISLTRFFMPFEVGEKAVLKAEPAVQGSLYHSRFHGKVALITGKRGRCYELKIRDGRKEKLLIVHPVHLKKLK